MKFLSSILIELTFYSTETIYEGKLFFKDSIIRDCFVIPYYITFLFKSLFIPELLMYVSQRKASKVFNNNQLD